MAFQAYNSLVGKIGEPTPSLAHAKTDAGPNGWVEAVETGNVVYGIKPVGTIKITPTWQSILPLLIMGIREGNSIALEELERMAQAADAYNKSTK